MGVLVNVGVGVSVGVGVNVSVGVGVNVAVGVSVFVIDGDIVGVGLFFTFLVGVGARDGFMRFVGVGVGLGLGTGLHFFGRKCGGSLHFQSKEISDGKNSSSVSLALLT